MTSRGRGIINGVKAKEDIRLYFSFVAAKLEVLSCVVMPRFHDSLSILTSKPSTVLTLASG